MLRFNFLVRPLQRMAVGGVLTATAFLISGFLELQLEVSLKKNRNASFVERVKEGGESPTNAIVYSTHAKVLILPEELILVRNDNLCHDDATFAKIGKKSL